MWVWWWLSLAVVVRGVEEDWTFNSHFRGKRWRLEPRRDHVVKFAPVNPNSGTYLWSDIPARSLDINVYFQEEEADSNSTTTDSSSISAVDQQVLNTCVYMVNPIHLGDKKYSNDDEQEIAISDAQLEEDPTTICIDALQNRGSIIGQEITCRNGQLKIPLADTWDFWRSLDKRERTGAARPRRVWASINQNTLEESLLQRPPSSPYHVDGTRKAYLRYDLPRKTRIALNAWLVQPPIASTNSSLHICYANVDDANQYTKITGVGRIHPRKASDISASLATTETSMRVFFEPGWRLRKSIRGTNLELTDRLAVKLNECEGKMDDLAMRVIKPFSKTSIPHYTQPNVSATADLMDPTTAPVKTTDILDFDVTVTPIHERDATSDWRRAAYIIRRAQRRSQLETLAKNAKAKGTQVPTRKVRERTPSEEGLKMTLCYYRDPSDLRGTFAGSTTYTLASSDAAEFVALSIFFLLWLPVCCMWTVGCLGYKHRSLRVVLRQMRLAQQREQIEARLAKYLGTTQKDDESSASEASAEGGTAEAPLLPSE